MQINLKFELSDFDTFKSFEKSVKSQLGDRIYVGTSSLCLYFDYPKDLAAMLKPYPPKKQLEFVLESSCPDEKKKKKCGGSFNWKNKMRIASSYRSESFPPHHQNVA